jgi:DNA-binding PadR family transcriptional regulator
MPDAQTPPQSPLGEFEVVVLLAVLHVLERGDAAYGSSVRDEIESRGGRPVARGAVYITLDRLEEKGLLSSRQASGPPVRGNRPRRLFKVTAAGIRGLRQSLGLVARMQSGLEPILGDLS